ncbi:MAG: sigma-70 family RNA polymerase sigma factor [Ruminococcaceae bacterium]|nr:sigma-70 family RNA polymerase sigma factor [Oscillospiraceae bacterium]
MEKKQIQTLIQRVRTSEGEDRQQAFDGLLRQYRPLIEALAARFSDEERAELGRDDLRQEALLVFYRSVMTYDTEQSEVEFGLYAKVCIYHGLISYLRLKENQESGPLSLSEGFEESLSEAEAEDPVATLIEREREQALDLVIRENLSAYEYRIWRLYVSGYTAGEIGRAEGKDEKSVHNAIYRIRRKLRAVLRRE